MPEENSEVTEADAPPLEKNTKAEARALKVAAEKVVAERKEVRAVAAQKLIDLKAAKKAAIKPKVMRPGRRLSKADALYQHCATAVAAGQEILIRDRGGNNTVVDIDNP